MTTFKLIFFYDLRTSSPKLLKLAPEKYLFHLAVESLAYSTPFFYAIGFLPRGIGDNYDSENLCNNIYKDSHFYSSQHPESSEFKSIIINMYIFLCIMYIYCWDSVETSAKRLPYHLVNHISLYSHRVCREQQQQKASHPRE